MYIQDLFENTKIVGTGQALRALQQAIEYVLKSDGTATFKTTLDGEEYNIKVIKTNDVSKEMF